MLNYTESFNARLEQALSIREVKPSELARRTGISQSTISQYRSGYAEPKKDKLSLIANALSVNPSWLMGLDVPMEIPNIPTPAPGITDDVISFPILGEVAAGYDHFAAQDWEGERVDLPAAWLHGLPRDNYFVLRVTGDSMYPLYHDGDIVLVKKQTTLNRSGEVGVIVYDDECASLKKVEYVPGEDWMKLIPLNPNFPPVTIKDEALEHCRVLGVPVKLVRDILQ